MGKLFETTRLGSKQILKRNEGKKRILAWQLNEQKLRFVAKF